MALLLRIPNVTDSDLGVKTDYPDRLLAVIRGSTAKYCDSNFNKATTTSFHVLPNQFCRIFLPLEAG